MGRWLTLLLGRVGVQHTGVAKYRLAGLSRVNGLTLLRYAHLRVTAR
jgi:hypothetical protein